MNNRDYNNYYQARDRLSQHRNFQLLRDIVNSYNDNIRTNNQYMLEYNRNIHSIIAYMRELNSQDAPMRRPRRTAPPPPRRHWNNTAFNYNSRNYEPPAIPIAPPIVNRDEPVENPRPRSRSLGEFIQSDYTRPNDETYEEAIQRLIVSNNDARTSVRTFTTIPNRELSTTFHNTSRNSIAELYRVLMRDFDDMMGFNNFVETTSTNQGLNDMELECGVMDISYNVALHGDIDTRCPIGLDDFEENETIKQIVECGHIFKVEPLLRWFSRHTKCPLCRCELRSEQAQYDVSFNFRTVADNMNADDVERDIDEITNSITQNMMERLGRGVEVNTVINRTVVNDSSSSDSD
jgi:hypothetical protein